jgi:tetratricopeptide (TPR) repeat protein
MKNKILILAALAALAFTTNAQQLKTPQASPTCNIKQNFALSDITIEYSRPGVKGRTVFGDLVPWGKVWRTGANGSTTISFGSNVKLEGNAVAAGKYALYTIPDKDSWQIMLYKDMDLGGDVSNYKQENELLRFKVKPTSISNKVETFTINIADITNTSANIELTWEQTKVSFKVTTDIDSTIMKNIDSMMANDSRPYFSAANYYYENDKDMKKALEWVNKAIELNPRYFVVHLKAKILMKMKDYNGAIAAAEQSLALAQKDKSDDYVRLNEKLIAEAKAKK